MRPFGRLSNDPPQYVSELIDHTSAIWDTVKLEEVCLPIDIPAILRIPLCTSEIQDSWSWFFEKNGRFSVRSAYRMMVAKKFRREAWLDGAAGSSSSDRDAQSWTSLWKISVPSKIRMFLWRLAKHFTHRRCPGS